MSDAFSDLAHLILDLAHAEAIRLDREHVGPAHLLLALLREQTNRPGEVLRRLNVSVDKVRMQLKKIEGDAYPEVHSYPIPRSSKLETAIQGAVEAARVSEPPGAVEPEHLLAGLLGEKEGTVAQILRELRVDMDEVHVGLLKRRQPASSRPTAPAADASVAPARRLETNIRRGEADASLRGLRDRPREVPSVVSRHLDSRFTDRARKVMQLATQEAQRFNHDHIGTMHILLGLVKEGSGIAFHVLQGMGVDLRWVRGEVEKIVVSGPVHVTVGRLPLSPRGKQVIELAIEEARLLGHTHIGTAHLLLGLARAEDGVARQVLLNLGISAEHVRAEVLRLLQEPD